MNRLPTAAKRALSLDASRETKEMIKWSLRSLANININHIANTNTNTEKNAINTNTKSGNVSREAAATLLKDVKLRLAGQHERCHLLLQEAQSIFLQGLDDAETHTDKDNDKNRNKSKVVKAVHSNWNLNARHASKQLEIASQLSSDAISSLSNLEAMHADTYRLVYDLLSSSSSSPEKDSPIVLQRFSSADQTLLKSTFEQIRSRHAQTVETMADVVIALRRRRRLLGKYDPSSPRACGLDRTLIDLFLRNRLGVQLLCDHYVALASKRGKKKVYGGVAVDCDLLDVLEDAVLEASHVCDANLGVAPEVYVSAHVGGGCLDGEKRDDDDSDRMTSIPSPSDFDVGGIYEKKIPDGQAVVVTLVRPWVHHALVEVLKNAAASSVRKMQQLPNDTTTTTTPHPPPLPPIHVRVLDEPTQVQILIIDRGVGLSPNAKQKAFVFAESAAAKRWDRLEEQQSYAMVRQPLGSLGVGLPLSRMMMQMFGGDVLLMNNNDDGKKEKKEEDEWNTGGCTTVVRLMKDDTLEERVGSGMMPVHDDCYEHERRNNVEEEVRNLVL